MRTEEGEETASPLPGGASPVSDAESCPAVVETKEALHTYLNFSDKRLQFPCCPALCSYFSRHVRRSLTEALAPELRAVYDSMAPTGPYKKNSEEVIESLVPLSVLVLFFSFVLDFFAALRLCVQPHSSSFSHGAPEPPTLSLCRVRSCVFSFTQVGRRRLRNTVLSYLHEPRDAAAAKLCFDQFKSADCMTDKLAAVACLADFDDAGGAFPERCEGRCLFLKPAPFVSCTHPSPVVHV